MALGQRARHALATGVPTMDPQTRRQFQTTHSMAAGALMFVGGHELAARSAPVDRLSDTRAANAVFPTHDPAVVQEFVTVAHGNLAKVQALVDRQPALAKAAFDWGFGDWETALGAASHVGSRPVAELLLAH